MYGIILSTPGVTRMCLLIIYSFTNSHVSNTCYVSGTVLNTWDTEKNTAPQESMQNNHFLNSYHVPSLKPRALCTLFSQYS